MISAREPTNEAARIAALEAYQILDSHAEAAFDAVARAAALICEAPIALISLVHRDRQWFKSAVGLELDSTPRESSFCAHAILADEILEVPDTLDDERFLDNPLVTGAPNIRFYAGAPLATPDQLALGALCVIDRIPRRLTARQRAVLTELSNVVMHLLASRKAEAAAAERLRKANLLLEMAETVAHVGHYRIDAATSDLRWSDEVFRIFGLDRSAGQPRFEAATKFIHPGDQAEAVALIRAVLASGEGYAREMRIVRPDGEIRDVSSWGEAERGENGAITALLGVFQDITERKIAKRELQRLKESAEQASEAKTDFLAAMSHEIRTPMNGVIGMNALMLETDLTPRQRKLAETIRYSADALLNVVDDILDVAKLEAGAVQLEDSDFDLPALIDRIVELLDARARQKGVALTAEVGAAARGVFRGEPARLRQILLNLVGNAIKFTERGRVAIVVTGRADFDRTHLRIEVRDTGIGVSQEARRRIFTPFEQADPSIARRFGGAGLGLNISRKLVELMDGRIDIDDNPGGGSIFWLEIALPRAEIERADPGREQEPRRIEASAIGSGRILLAEDNRVNIEVATFVLQGVGYVVDLAVDGLEAVEAARRTDYDLILMDMQMPGMDGLSATRAIRGAERDGQRVPIIAMTANAMAGDRRRCLDAGMDDYLSKPFAPDKLRQMVARWIPVTTFPGSGADEAASLDALPVLEPAAIEFLRASMTPTQFSDLMAIYLAQADAQAEQFPLWRARLTLSEIGDEAHMIVSSAGALGARRLQALAGRLQIACRSGSGASTPALIADLARASASASSALRRMLPCRSASASAAFAGAEAAFDDPSRPGI